MLSYSGEGGTAGRGESASHTKVRPIITRQSIKRRISESFPSVASSSKASSQWQALLDDAFSGRRGSKRIAAP
eukprot:scaffold1954_cov268-Pinguiococcus_pyrenoidosus.AAC.255